VVPTKRMAKVPIEALTDRYTVSYVPSGSFHAIRTERHRPLSGDSLLVLADPEFTVAPLPEPPAKGVLLTAVAPGDAAAVAELKPGDVLLRVGKAELATPDDLTAALKQPGPLAVVAWRDGAEVKARVPGGKLGVAVDKRTAQ